MTASAPSPANDHPVSWAPPDPLPDGLRTRRLVIRAYQPGDARALFEAIDRSRASLLPWLPWAATQHLNSQQSAESIDLFRRVAAERPMRPEHNAVFGFVLGIFRADDGALVGGTGFNRIVHDSADAELGYWLAADARGRGYCTEAVGALIDWGLRPARDGGWGLRRVRIFAAAANVASCAVPRRLGLREEARFVRDRWVPGHGWCDTIGWGVTVDEPMPRAIGSDAMPRSGR